MSVLARLRNRRAPLVVLAIALTGGGVYALARGTRGQLPSQRELTAGGGESSRPSAEGSRVAVPSSTDVAPRGAVIRAPSLDETAAPVDHVAALRRGLASADEATRIAAVEAAVSATALETLADLGRFELARDPETAPTVIHAVALLGASADGDKRDDAATTLTRWLRDEMKREAPDALGNVSNIVEALGDVGGRNAVNALGAALDRADLALHVQTLAVAKLGELGDAQARGPVERFARRVAALPAADGIDEELRVEAIAAARATLSRI